MASGILGNLFRSIAKTSLFLFIPVALMGTCGGCHTSTTKTQQSALQMRVPDAPLLKGRVIIDPEFSGPEQELIAKGIRMWTNPLSDVLQMEISDRPIQEINETMVHQRLVLTQERAASDIPMPDPNDEDAEDTWEDPHDKWDSFDSRTPFWDTARGCNDHIVILRYTSNNPMIRFIERKIDSSGHGQLYGHTDNSCHRKAIILVVDRLKTSEQFTEVLSHEFGHALGLRHDFEANASIMHPDTKASRCVTRRDADAFCSRWQCSKSRPRMSEAKSCG